MNIGTYTAQDAINWGLSGVMLRSVGIKRDIRLNLFETYANYYYLNFKSFYSKKGDSFDRYLLRISEMVESLQIINQLIIKLKNQKTIKKNYLLLGNTKQHSAYTTMEKTIKHFKY
jgi:NADH:ubiquinone oxidoreductase subunit D